MGQLTTYLTGVQTLLHDPTNNAWSAATLTNYINEARRRVAKDTWCLRDLSTGINLVAGQERYVINNTLPAALQGQWCGVAGIDIYYGSSRFPLTYMPWRKFSLQLRYWQNLQQLPVAWSVIGGNVVYVGPIPDQSYVTDWDVASFPAPLTNDSQPEPIPQSYTDAIPWWAARLAKTNEQAFGEAQFFEAEYFKQLGIETAAVSRFQYTPGG